MHLLSRSRVGLAAAGTALILLVSACGSSSDSSSKPPSTEAAATTTVGGSATTSATGGGGSNGGNGQGNRGAGMEEAITAFTDCLTQQGITVPDVSIPTGRGDGGTPGNGSFPTGSFPTERRGSGGNGGPPADGSFPGGAPNGSFPGGGNGANGGNFDFTTMIVERLGLDTSDPTVKAAVDACSSTLTSAFPNRGNGNGGQAPTTTTA